MIAAPLLLCLLQTGGWIARPNTPTVGDTIRLERTIVAPPGWRVRAGRLPSGSVADPLSEAVVSASSAPGAWSATLCRRRAWRNEPTSG